MAQEFGRINVFGELEYAPTTIIGGNSIILNPTEGEYVANGYKPVIVDERPDTTQLDAEETFYRLRKYYEETETTIYVRYEILLDVDTINQIEEETEDDPNDPDSYPFDLP